MHINTAFTAVQILWTLTFAALLVLLVVLLGRDRARRYPWFTACIVLVTVDLLGKRLLFERLPQLTFAGIFITLGDLIVIVNLLVLVEMARRAFSGAQRSAWIVNTLGLLAVAGGVVAVWGPWPAWKTLTANSQIAVLGLLQLGEIKGILLVNVLTVELGLLVVLFGRRFKAGWRSHTQQIVIGISTVAIAQLVKQSIYQAIVNTSHVHPLNRVDYERVIGLVSRLPNAQDTVYLAVVLWWIACLWKDEPGTVATTPAEIPAVTGEAEKAAEPEDASVKEEQVSDQ